MGILGFMKLHSCKMKIELASGKTLDTDKLDDKYAELAEAVDTFYKVCVKYNATAIARVIVNDEKYFGCNSVPENPELKQKHGEFLIDTLGDWIHKVTGGKIGLCAVENPEGSENNLE